MIPDVNDGRKGPPVVGVIVLLAILLALALVGISYALGRVVAFAGSLS